MKLQVRYSATFETTIEVDEPTAPVDFQQHFSDELADINIPENKLNQYQPDTFEILSVTKAPK
jgi:hypothetical protein